MTPWERDVLAMLLSINTVFMILVLPGVVPITYEIPNDLPALVFTTLVWGIPLGMVGIWVNRRTADLGKSSSPKPPRRT